MFGNSNSERGAAAIEFAIVVPVLVLMLVGTIEVSRLQAASAAISDAARAAARSFSIGNNAVTAVAAGIAASDMDLQPADFSIDPATDTCAAGELAQVSVTYDFEYATGLMQPVTLTGKAMYACQ